MDEGTAGQEVPIRAPGPSFYKKKVFLGRFPLTSPDFSSDVSSWSLHPDNGEGSSSSKSKGLPRTWLLENPESGKPAQKGVMEGGLSSAATYFVLIRQGDEFVAVPVDHWFNFKPLRPEGDASLEQVESDMKKADNIFGNRLVPKSVAKQEQERDEPKPRNRNLFGSDDEGEVGVKKRKQRKNDNEDDDEAPEDLYAGVEDDLRPERPEQAEDWEHELNADDDDEEMGDDLEEKLEDDPGERKKLGLEEEEEEELDEAGRAIKKLVDRENNSDSDNEADKPEDADGDDDGLDALDEETMDLDEVFKDDEDKGGEGKGARTSRSASPAPGPRGEGPPSRKRTPPPPVNRKAGAAPVAAGGAKRKGDGAPGEDQAKRARVDTKPGAPRPVAVKTEVKQEPVTVKQEPGAPKPARAAPPTGAAGRRPPSQPGGAAALGLPTPDEIKQVVGSNRFSVKALISHFKGRIKKEDTGTFQKTVLSVAKLSKGPDGQSYLELK